MRRAFACTCPWPCDACATAPREGDTGARHPSASFSAESSWFGRETPTAPTLTFRFEEPADRTAE